MKRKCKSKFKIYGRVKWNLLQRKVHQYWRMTWEESVMLWSYNPITH